MALGLTLTADVLNSSKIEREKVRCVAPCGVQVDGLSPSHPGDRDLQDDGLGVTAR